MRQTLSIELSDETYRALRRAAEAAGVSPTHLAAVSLEQQYEIRVDARSLSEAEQQAARERFDRHIGEVDMGYPTGADNERIDADLARFYAT